MFAHALVVLILASSDAQPQGDAEPLRPEVTLSVGTGANHGWAGVRGSIRRGVFGASLGLGLPVGADYAVALLSDRWNERPTLSPSPGVQVYFTDPASAWQVFASLNGIMQWSIGAYPSYEFNGLDFRIDASATVAVRWSFGGGFLEAGTGLIRPIAQHVWWRLDRHGPITSAWTAPPDRLYLDATLAGGFRF